MPGVILDRRVSHGEHVSRETRLQAVRAERAERDGERREQRTGGEKELQAGFLVFFAGRPGRFLP